MGIGTFVWYNERVTSAPDFSMSRPLQKRAWCILAVLLALPFVFFFPHSTHALTCGTGSSGITFYDNGDGTCVGFLTTPGAGTFTVPTDWNSSNNSIEVIGGGGGGDGLTLPGSGAAYSKRTNLSISGTVGYSVGAAGAAGTSGNQDATNGGNTWLCNSTTNCTSAVDSAAIIGVSGGFADCDIVTGNGCMGGYGLTQVSASTTYRGGSGGNAPGAAGSGGGGAAGPGGAGRAGGSDSNAAGSGGGAGGGSSTAGSSGGGGTGANGGEGPGGSGHGVGTTGAGGDATAGSGAGGASGAVSSGCSGCTGGAGGSGGEWDGAACTAAGLTHCGAGGGGGGGGYETNSSSGFAGKGGGAYGGGGGAASFGAGTHAGGAGGQGIIVITYTPAEAAPTGRIIRLIGGVRLLGGVRLGGTSPVPR